MSYPKVILGLVSLFVLYQIIKTKDMEVQLSFLSVWDKETMQKDLILEVMNNKLVLTHHKSYLDNDFHIEFVENQKSYQEKVLNCVYQGVIENNLESFVSINPCEGHGEIYFSETEQYELLTKDSKFILKKRKLLLQEGIYRQGLKRRAVSVNLWMNVMLGIDFELYQQIVKNADVNQQKTKLKSYVMRFLNLASNIYGVNGLDINGFRLKPMFNKIVVFKDKSILDSRDGNQYLDAWVDYWTKRKGNSNVGMLLRSKSMFFEGSEIVGLTNKVPPCHPLAAGTVVHYGEEGYLLKTFGHELLHTMDVDDDYMKPECDQDKIMGIGLNTELSKCTINDLQKSIQQKNLNCLFKAPVTSFEVENNFGTKIDLELSSIATTQSIVKTTTTIATVTPSIVKTTITPTASVVKTTIATSIATKITPAVTFSTLDTVPTISKTQNFRNNLFQVK